MWKLAGSMVLFGIVCVGGCGSSKEETGKTDHCLSMQKQCDACADESLKQACMTTLVTYRNGGETGQSACKTAVESSTYVGSECLPCAHVKKGCEECDGNLRTQCEKEVSAMDPGECRGQLAAGTTPVCTPCARLKQKCASCPAGEKRDGCMKVANEDQSNECRERFADACT